MKTKLAVLGCGNMGSAVALGLAKKSKDFQFFTYTPTHTRAEKLARDIGGQSVQNVLDLKGCEYFLIACKPQQFEDLTKELKEAVNNESRIISVMAGIPSIKIQKNLGCKKIARVMPNTPCLISEGACAIYLVNMNKEEKETVQNIFEAVAEVFFVNSDDEIDMATAVIGSGPSYYFEITRIIAAKLASLGMDPKKAEAMTKQVAKGAALLMSQSKNSPETLRNNVTSKKGTTEAALETFKARNLQEVIEAAIEAAYQRAKELSR